LKTEKKKTENCKLKFYDDDWSHSVQNRDYSCGIGKREDTCTKIINLPHDDDLEDDIYKVENISTNCTCEVTFDGWGGRNIFTAKKDSTEHFTLIPKKSEITKDYYVNKVTIKCRRTNR